MGRVLAYTIVGGATLGVYIVISTPTHFDIKPPIQPLQPVVTTPTTKPTVPWGKPGGPKEPQYPFTTPPFDPQLMCDAIKPMPPNCPVKPTPWPGQHYGEQIV
jgi:hypothetical protein